ncbi:TetR family transcriptional regulator [Saccharomonospora sp. CUA-673]|uniref:TetR family transcriptional regulator n=1 Tax=Saccharomonospora sp. CUA-673 TaxID=1904969 RepID=UPI000959D6ED|nr:TetR family transcriptional regulator [Saccharomonospora sp. CUA-673]OLT43983.1 TetR family transcriptional regulator [Saccharomonospora sp. CUA-673]
MSQRDALLAGAKRCLAEKGYGRATARDVAAAAGANLGSIGYHFGSKDRLLSLAAIELTSEWGDAIESAARVAVVGSPVERLAALVAELARGVPGARDLQAAGLQVLAHAERDEELRPQVAEALTTARCQLAAVVLGRDEVAPGSSEERGVGFLAYAIVAGLVAQALLDPDTIADPDELQRAVQGLFAGAG